MSKNGLVIWKNDIISFVVTGLEKTANRKTGNILQSWIIRNDMNPTEAVKTGKDSAICGDCPLKGNKGKGRSCYVVYSFGPNAIYKTLKKYSGEDSKIDNNILRLGSYGDPAYVPLTVIKKLVSRVKKHLGYTHRWRLVKTQPYKKYLMASVENLADKKKANKMGWRTFRVAKDLKTIQKDEILCPASEEAGFKLTCKDCGVCNGNYTGRKKNVVIPGHGSKLAVGKNIKKITE